MPKKKPRILTRFLLRILLALSTLPLLALMSLTTTSFAAAHAETPKTYLALGDSLAFGFQPNQTVAQDFLNSYANDLFQTLKAKNHFDTVVDLGCPGETSSTFINGTCPVQIPPPPQLGSALAYLQLNPGKVGLVTLQIGGNDLLPTFTITPTSCAVNTQAFDTGLANLDNNLTKVILPALRQALKKNDDRHARLALINYYNPFQLACPISTPFIQKLNRHLESDAEDFADTVDIYDSFDPTNVCQLTWFCSVHDIHPTTQGYQVIADDIYSQLFSDDD